MWTFSARCTTLLSVLLVIGAAQAPATAQEKTTGHLEFIPPDAPGFLTINLKDVWTESIVKEFHKKVAADPKAASMFKEVEKFTGLDPRQIERISIIFPSTPEQGDGPLLILTTQQPLDKAKLQTAFFKQGGTKKQTNTGKAYIGSESTVLYFANDNTFIAGPPRATLAYLEKELPSKQQRRLKGVRTLVAKNTVVVIADLADYGKELEKAKLFGPVGGTEPLCKANPFLLTLTCGKDTRLDLKMTFASEDEAKEAVKAVNSVRGQTLAQIGIMQKQLAKEADNPKVKESELAQWFLKQANTSLGAFKEGVKKATTTRKGQDVQVALRADVAGGEVVLWTTMATFWLVRFSPNHGLEPVPSTEESKKTPGSGSDR